MTKSLHLAFLAAAMATTSTLASAKPPAPPPPAPAPQFIGNGIGSFSFSGADDGLFYVTLAPGKYEITGTIDASIGSANSYNLTGAALKTGSVIDDLFEMPSGKHFVENPFFFTVLTPTQLLLDVATNLNTHNNIGTYGGTLTIAAVPQAAVVPEPAMGALLLAGLGMLGISARRRRV